MEENPAKESGRQDLEIGLDHRWESINIHLSKTFKIVKKQSEFLRTFGGKEMAIKKLKKESVVFDSCFSPPRGSFDVSKCAL